MPRGNILKKRAFQQGLTTSHDTSREPKKVLLMEVLCQFAQHPGIWGQGWVGKANVSVPQISGDKADAQSLSPEAWVKCTQR